MAAGWPDHLLGPRGAPILTAGYEGFTKASWSALVNTSPMTAKYIGMLFRLYGVYCLVFGVMATAIAVTAFRRGDGWSWWTLLGSNTIALVSAMTYDWTVNAIGPFELTEYLGVVSFSGRSRSRLRSVGPAGGRRHPIHAARKTAARVHHSPRLCTMRVRSALRR
jgi:hypothetical protein